MFGLGTGEVLVILVVTTLIFGGKRLPELGRGLGQGMRGFRDALKGIDEPDQHGQRQDPASRSGADKPADREA